MAGPLGTGVTANCSFVDGQVMGSAQATFVGWFPGVPDLSFNVEVAGVKESDG
jgi:hypothetical protein